MSFKSMNWGPLNEGISIEKENRRVLSLTILSIFYYSWGKYMVNPIKPTFADRIVNVSR